MPRTTSIAAGGLFVLLATACAGSATAQEFYDIVGEGGAREQPYANVRGWEVSAGYVDGRFAYCVAASPTPGPGFLVGYSNEQWQFAIQYAPRVTGDQDEIQVNQQVVGAPYPVAPYTYSHSRDGIWTVSWVGASEIDGFRNGSELILDIDRYSFAIPLNGSAATLTKIEECVRNSGHPPGSSTAWQQPSPQSPGQAFPSPASQAAPAQGAQGAQVAPGVYRGVVLQTGNWEVAWLSRDPEGRGRIYCEAISIQDSEHAIRLAFDASKREFQYGFMSYASHVSPQLPVTFWFDNDRSSGESIMAQWQRTAEGVDWIGGYDSSADGPGIEESFIDHGAVNFSYPVPGGQHVATFSLAGSGDALSRMFDCAWTQR